MRTEWAVPDGIDAEVVELCRAMNRWPGITTYESCHGHGHQPFRIWFGADSLDVLPGLLYWFDQCHSGLKGWQVIATTDCACEPVVFILEGPILLDQTEPDAIAALINADNGYSVKLESE